MKKKGRVRLGIVGGGKMGEALVRGLLDSGRYRCEQIRVGEPDGKRRRWLGERYGVEVFRDNTPVVSEAEVCILAVKPQDMQAMLGEIASDLSGEALLVSIAAGITTGWIQERLGQDRRIVRAMPNAAALVGNSATGIYFRPEVDERDRKIVLEIFDSVGATVVVTKEEHLNIVTGLSGSGPAYVFLFLEALTDAGVYLGLQRDVAARLSLQTVRGSVDMALELGKPYAQLKEIITSPGGTTMAGLKVLEEGALRALVMRAVEMATHRSEELSL